MPFLVYFLIVSSTNQTAWGCFKKY